MRSPPRAAIGQLAALWAAAAASAGMAFATQVVLARTLGPGKYGFLSAAWANVTLLAPLAGFGVGQTLLLVTGREGWSAARLYRPALQLVALATTASLAIYMLSATKAFADTKHLGLVLPLAVPLISIALGELLQARLQLEGRFSQLAFWSAVPSAARLVVAVAAAVVTFGLTGVAVGYAIAGVPVCAAASLSWRALERKTIRLVGHGRRPSGWKSAEQGKLLEAVAGAWPFALAGFFYLVYYQSDVILVNWLRGPEAAGVYNAGFVVLMGAYLIPSVTYQRYLMPKLQRWAVHDTAKFARAYRIGSAVLTVAGICVAVLLIVLAPLIVRLLFGGSFQIETSRILRILAFAVPLRYAASSAGGVLATQNYMRERVWYEGLAAGLNIGLNLLFIPRMGAPGAAITTVISEFALLFMYRLAIRVKVARGSLCVS